MGRRLVVIDNKMICKICGICKELSLFNKKAPKTKNALGYTSTCKKCWGEISRKRYHANKEKERELRIKYKRRNKAGLNKEKLDDIRVCSICKESKQLRHFVTNYGSHSGYSYRCKPCQAAISRKIYHADIEKSRTKSAAWYAKNREKINAQRRQKLTPELKFKAALRNATRRKIEWGLTLEQYVNLVTQSCHYCKRPIKEYGTSLDRVNNKIGYVIDNVVPCCGFCNSIKSDILTEEETLAAVSAIMALREIRGVP